MGQKSTENHQPLDLKIQSHHYFSGVFDFNIENQCYFSRVSPNSVAGVLDDFSMSGNRFRRSKIRGEAQNLGPRPQNSRITMVWGSSEFLLHINYNVFVDFEKKTRGPPNGSGCSWVPVVSLCSGSKIRSLSMWTTLVVGPHCGPPVTRGPQLRALVPVPKSVVWACGPR